MNSWETEADGKPPSGLAWLSTAPKSNTVVRVHHKSLGRLIHISGGGLPQGTVIHISQFSRLSQDFNVLSSLL